MKAIDMKILFVILFLLTGVHTIQPQSMRPIRDSIGFCWNADEMNSFIEFLSKEAKPSQEYSSSNLIGGISVHDDYLYAGKVYFPLFSKIKAKEVVIFGVTHGTVRKEMNDPKNILILDEFDEWQGPYGTVAISPLRELIKTKLPKQDYWISNKAHSIEHSIEALIPFLQYYNRDVRITPIIVTQMPFERMEEVSDNLSKIILDYIKTNNLTLGKDIFFLISNDADHYGEDFNNAPFGMDERAHKKATDNDRIIIKEDLTGEINPLKLQKLTTELWPDAENKKPIPIWCGRYPIVFGLMTIAAVTNSIRGELFQYSDTFTEKVLPIKTTSMGLTAVFSLKHWCGFFSLGIYSYM